MKVDGAVVRVERGQAGPEEVAAITAVLLARAAARPDTPAPARRGRTRAGWHVPGYRAAHSWQG
ncbi:acyl-CoA carboxylase epsilon subunit [Streptomyces puniciscabiei]|uniref:acyl-CoA carboxylase epsilon subunit n=1 Tax=Streptomyces puniciscabiei TaxID=164348 RepID=UPI00332FA7DC